MSVYVTELKLRGKKLRGREYHSAFLFAECEEELIGFINKMEYLLSWAEFFPGGTMYIEILRYMHEKCIENGAELIGEEYLNLL